MQKITYVFFVDNNYSITYIKAPSDNTLRKNFQIIQDSSKAAANAAINRNSPANKVEITYIFIYLS